MLKKLMIGFALLLCSKAAYSQLQIGTNEEPLQHAILEVSGAFFSKESVVIYRDGAKPEDITARLNSSEYAYNNIVFNTLPQAQKGLICINYMEKLGYKYLNTAFAYSGRNNTAYQYQYMFEKSKQ